MTLTPLWLNGFESQAFSTDANAVGSRLWQAITGTAATAETTTVRSGAASMKQALPTSAYQGRHDITTLSAQSRLACRFYFRKTGNPSVAVTIYEQNASNGPQFSIQLGTGGTLQARVAGGTSPTNGGTSSALNNDQWYCVEFSFDGSTTAHAMRLRIDGSDVSGDATSTATGAAAITAPRFGVVNSVTLGTARDFFWDDFIIGSNTSHGEYWGAGQIVALVPESDGTHSPNPPTAGRFKDAGGTDISGSNVAWDNLTTLPLTQTSVYIEQPVAAGTEYLEVNLTTVSASTINGVQGEVGASSSTTGANTSKCSIYNGSTENVVYSGDLSETGAMVRRALVTVANQGELDALVGRVGYGTAQPGNPRWLGLLVEVDYVAGGTTTEKAGTGVMGLSGSGPKQVIPIQKSGSGVQGFTASAADQANFAELGSGILEARASGADAFFPTETGTGVRGHVGSGVDQTNFVETGQGTLGLTASAVDQVTFSETGTGVLGLVGSGTKILLGAKLGSGVLGLVGSGVKEYVPAAGGNTYTKAGVGILGYGVGRPVKAGDAVLGLSGSGSVRTNPAYKSGTGELGFTASGTQTKQLNRAGTGIINFTGTGVVPVEIRAGSVSIVDTFTAELSLEDVSAAEEATGDVVGADVQIVDLVP